MMTRKKMTPTSDRSNMEAMMACITVYESVDGPKLRALYKRLNCSEFEALGILVFLWLWGLNNADHAGMLLHADRDDIEGCIRRNAAGCRLSTADIVDALIDTGWIDTGGDGQLYLHDWNLWEEQWCDIKAHKKDAATQQIGMSNPSGQDADSKTAENDSAVQMTISGTESASADKYSKAFTEFWSIYPRKSDKGMAYKKYKARRNDGYSDAELIAAAKAYAEEVKRNHTESQYIKHAKTFLSDSLPFAEYLNSNPDALRQDAWDGESNPFSKYVEEFEVQ